MPAAFASFRAAVSLLPPQRSNGDWEFYEDICLKNENRVHRSSDRCFHKRGHSAGAAGLGHTAIQ